MQLDQAANESQADSEAAAGAVERMVGLHEKIEDLVLHVGRDADSVVAYLQHGAPVQGTQRDGDPATGLGVLRGVGEQVRDDLFEPRGVSAHQERTLRKGDGQVVTERFDRGKGGLDGERDDRLEVNRRLAQIDMAASDAGDVEEVFEKAGHVLNLAPGDDDRVLDQLIAAGLQVNDFEGMGQRRQGIAKLVGEHGQKLVLALAGLLEALGLAQ